MNDRDVVYPPVLSADACAVPDECETPLSFSGISGSTSVLESPKNHLCRHRAAAECHGDFPLSNKVS